MSAHNPWHFVDKFPGDCATEVPRNRNVEPCGEIASAVAFNSEGYWPVCIQHAHARGIKLVPLVEILAHNAVSPSC